MRAVVYKGIKNIVVEDRDVPEIGPKDVLVKNIRAGICGTDMSAYTKGGDALGIFPGSLIGHEFASEVVEVGAEVDDSAIVPGLRVFVNASTSKRLGQGRSQLEVTDSAGGMTQFIAIEDAKIGYNLHPLADHVTFDQAVLIEPFSVANHAVNEANVHQGERALVFGAGAVGLGALAVLKAKGIDEVIVSDIQENRLEVVKKLGGIPVNALEQDPIEFAAELFGTSANFIDEQRPNVDIYIDSSGAPNSVPDYLRGGKPGSRLVLLALPPRSVEIPQTPFVMSELSILSSLAYNNEDIAEVVQYLADKKFDPTPVITHHFSQEDVVEAFEKLLNDSSDVIKVVVDVDA
ncbi:MAG: zinc-binding dehydrogenase [Corynebacterium glutamicum]|nr:zinc-binding dehydrogenase [Corynebacterium glutamicum]